LKKVLRVVFIYLPMVFVLAVLGGAYFVTENRPAVTSVRTPTAADATRANALWKRVVDQILNATTVTTLIFKEKDVNGVFALMSRAIPRLVGEASISPRGLDVAITLRLLRNPLRNYVNLRFGLKPSATGLDIATTSLGRIPIPGAAMTTLIRHSLNLMLGDDTGSKLIQSVTAAQFKQEEAKLRLEPVPDLRERLLVFSRRLGDVRNEVSPLGNRDAIGIYYTSLVELDYIGMGYRSVSLAEVLGPLFLLVKDRSEFGHPAKENQDALLALVIYFGDRRFERLTGPVRRGVLKGHRRRNRGVGLGGRRDLLLHFIISAGLKLVSDHGIAMAIGEFKELLDSNEGGSGFSFVDLAADRAGLRFAEIAADANGGARHLLGVLAGKANEKAFFPHFTDLPEGLSEGAFKRRYGDVNDSRYVGLVAEIDRRLAKAEAYAVKSMP
jgi:hypothetical protein